MQPWFHARKRANTDSPPPLSSALRFPFVLTLRQRETFPPELPSIVVRESIHPRNHLRHFVDEINVGPPSPHLAPCFNAPIKFHFHPFFVHRPSFQFSSSVVQKRLNICCEMERVLSPDNRSPSLSILMRSVRIAYVWPSFDDEW